MSFGHSKRIFAAGGRGGGASPKKGGGAEPPDESGPGTGPRDFGREAAVARARAQSPELRRIREALDCQPPWDIAEIHFSADQDRRDVWVFETAGYWPCPTCATYLPGRGHTATQVFRCLTCESETYVYVKIPVVECPVHLRQQVSVPWTGNQEKWRYSPTIAPDDDDASGG